MPNFSVNAGNLNLTDSTFAHMRNRDMMEQQMDNVVKMLKGNKILDVGTGFGNALSRLMADPSISVVSIDPEAWSFSELEKKYEDAVKEGRVKFLAMPVEKIDFPDNFFDTSIALDSLHHTKEPEIGIREMERVSSKAVVITEWHESSGGIHNPHSKDHLKNIRDNIEKYCSTSGYSKKVFDYWYMFWKYKE